MHRETRETHGKRVGFPVGNMVGNDVGSNVGSGVSNVGEMVLRLGSKMGGVRPCALLHFQVAQVIYLRQTSRKQRGQSSRQLRRKQRGQCSW